jgi:branched-chain amino acid transport system permease protein
MAVRDDEDAAAELGVNGFTVKLLAFTVSAWFTGLAGALLALEKVSLEPYSLFSVSWVSSMIVMCGVGGVATLAGPIIGAVVIFALQQALQDFVMLSTLLLGVLLIVIVLIAPKGLTGLFGMIVARLSARPPIQFKLSTSPKTMSPVPTCTAAEITGTP